MLTRSFLTGRPMASGIEQMERLFDHLVGPGVGAVAPRFAAPALNIAEDGDTYVVEAELPGLTLDAVEVFVANDELTIRGTRTIETPENARTLRRERAAGAFERTITLPGAVETDAVEASLRDGVLTVRLPKAASLRPRRIEIRSATA
jgi:HSP20 family protein